MRLEDLTVEVRNSSLARVGQILAADLIGLELALRYNKLGAWKITLRSDHPLVDSLRAPGAGLIVTGPTGVLISGPTVSATNSKTSEDPTGTWDVIGTDDALILGERLAYPVPTTADLTLQTSAYDTRTGAAETIAKAYVNANVGPSAPVARRNSAVTIDTDLGRGTSLTVNARFDTLGELVESILTPSTLGFNITQSGASLVFTVYAPVDRSSLIRMDVDNLRLSKSEYTYSSPSATRVIVGGSGQGAARVLLERSSTESIAAETSWGRRIEVFKDARSTSATGELQASGDEILTDRGFTVEGIKVSPSDDLASMRYGVDWNLGDKVTVVVGAAQVAKIVTEVGIVITEDGVKVGATVGDPASTYSDATSAALDATTNQEARISVLERNDTVSITDATVTTAKIADSAVTSLKIADSAVTSAKIADGTIVDADVSASAAIAVSKLAASSVTLNGNSITLGGSGTVTASQITSGTLPIAQGGSGVATGAGLVPIIPTSATYGTGSGTISANGLVTFTNSTILKVLCFSSTYSRYRIYLDIQSCSANDYVYWRGLDASGNQNVTSAYNTGSMYQQSGTVPAYDNGNNVQTYSRIGYATNDDASSYIMDISNPFQTRKTKGFFVSQYSGSGLTNLSGAYVFNATTSFSGIQFAPFSIPSSWTGTIRIFGVL
jgi:hypothetical protein